MSQLPQPAPNHGVMPFDEGKWNEILNHTVGPFRVRSRDRRPVSARLNSVHGAGIGLIDLIAAPHSSAWVKELAMGSWANKYVMTVVISGDLHIQSGPTSESFSPGDIGFSRTDRPAVIEVGEEFRALYLTFPESGLPLDKELRHNLSGLRMPATSTFAPVIGNLLRSLGEGLGTLDPSLQYSALSSALELVATLVRGEMGTHPTLDKEDERAKLLRKVQEYIFERLHEPSLGVKGIAQAHFVSTRYIHLLFERIGQTPGAWIREQRFERARKDLSDPLQTQTPVAAIAERWGYSTASHFGQTFKTVTGMTPSEYRVIMLGPIKGARTLGSGR